MPIRKPRHLRAVAASLCLAVAGCGGTVASDDGGGRGDDPERTEASATGTETPPPAPTPYTGEQLNAAMPTEADIPDGYTVTVRCPGADNCGPSDLENAYVVVARTDADTEDFFAIGLTEFPDAATALDTAESTRADRSAQVGDYRIPAEQTEEGLIPGRRGTGELEDVTVDGWSGYRFVTTYQRLGDEGEVGPSTTEGYLLLVRGTTMAAVQVIVPGNAVDAMADRLDTEMRTLLGRLGD